MLVLCLIYQSIHSYLNSGLLQFSGLSPCTASLLSKMVAKWYASLHAQMPFSLELTKPKEKMMAQYHNNNQALGVIDASRQVT